MVKAEGEAAAPKKRTTRKKAETPAEAPAEGEVAPKKRAPRKKKTETEAAE